MTYRYIIDSNAAVPIVAQFIQQPVLGVDIETCALPKYADIDNAALDPYRSSVRLLSVATLEGEVAVFDLHRIDSAVLQPLCTVPWAVFNGSFEYRHLTHRGWNVPALHDAQLLYRLHSHQVQLASLADVSKDVLLTEMDKTEQTSDWSGELSTEQASLRRKRFSRCTPLYDRAVALHRTGRATEAV